MSLKVTDGFKVVPIRVSATSTSHHELFIKEHSVRIHTIDKPANRTLFILNVPPYITENYLKNVFSRVGSVHSVIFQIKYNEKHNDDVNLGGFKTAFVVFEKSTSVKKALSLDFIDVIPKCENVLVTGMKKWMMEYNKQIYDRTKLEEEVNDYVSRFDQKMEKEKQQGNEINSEGWTVVTRKGKNRGFARKESRKNRIMEKMTEQGKRKHLTDFYVFQKRESKMNHLVQMRKKYEEDKKKVATMKQSRKFKPF